MVPGSAAELYNDGKVHDTVPEKITLGNGAQVASGSYHSFAIDVDGNVWAWGSNHLGRTGTGRNDAADDEVRLPKKVKGLSRPELGE